jgi:hypothetical protein
LKKKLKWLARIDKAEMEGIAHGILFSLFCGIEQRG